MRRVLQISINVLSCLVGSISMAQSLPQRQPLPPTQLREFVGNDSFGYPLALPDKGLLVRMLLQHDFQALDATLDGLEREAEADFRKEDWIQTAIDSFAIPALEFREPLDRWLAAHGKSPFAYLARSAYLAALAVDPHASLPRGDAPSAVDAVRGYLQQAIADALRATELNPQFRYAFAQLVRLYSLAGDGPQAEQAFQAGLKLEPRSFWLRQAYMKSLELSGATSADAMEAFATSSEALIEQNPRLRVLRGEILSSQALALPDTQGSERCKLLKQAIALGPDDERFRELAKEEERLQRPKDALVQSQNALARLPQSALLLNQLARLSITLGHAEEAEKYLDAADTFDVVGPAKEARMRLGAEMIVGMAMILSDRGKVEEALTTLRRGESKYPGYGQNHYWRGLVLQQAGRNEEAVEEYLEAVRANPRELMSYKSLDYLMSRQGRWEELLVWWNQYLELVPRDRDALLKRSDVHSRLGDSKASLADAQQSCNLGLRKACDIVSERTEQ